MSLKICCLTWTQGNCEPITHNKHLLIPSHTMKLLVKYDIINGLVDLAVNTCSWQSQWQVLKYALPLTAVSHPSNTHSCLQKNYLLNEISSAQASRCSFFDLSDFQPEEQRWRWTRGLVRHWCATAPITLTWAHTHRLLTLPQIGLSLWSNERCDVWGRSGWERDRRSERDWEWVGEREIERCRGSWGGCVWKASDHGKSHFFSLFFGTPLQTDVWVQLRYYVSQARFTQPKQTLITDRKLFNKMKTKVEYKMAHCIYMYIR